MIVTSESFAYISRIVFTGRPHWKTPVEKFGYFVLDELESGDMSVHLSDGTVYQGKPVIGQCKIKREHAAITLTCRQQAITIEGPFLPKKDNYDSSIG